MILSTKIDTPLGLMIACATEDGICLLEFNDRHSLKTGFSDLAILMKTEIEPGENKHTQTIRKQLNEYFAGKRKEFTVPLVMPGSEFQQAVWKELQKIPFGSVRTYMHQAEALNKPEAIRAVAHANGMNRISIVIPCHRVVGSNGKLTGYAGGLNRKKWLLDHEKKYSGKAIDLELF